MTKHKINLSKSQQILMYVEFANVVKAVDNDLHDSCWGLVYSKNLINEE